MQHSKLQSNQLSPVDAIYPQIIHNLHKPICSTQKIWCSVEVLIATNVSAT